MGMDYRYMGSASYPRFEEEITKVAAVFGGRETKEIQEHHEKCLEEPLGYWFGYMFPKEGEVEQKFVFPEGTNDTVIKWLNHPYNEMSWHDVVTVWAEVQQHPEIKEISRQIWYELENLVNACESWEIT